MKININIPKTSSQNSGASDETNETRENQSAKQSPETNSKTVYDSKTSAKQSLFAAQNNTSSRNLNAKYNVISLENQAKLIKQLLSFPDDIESLLSTFLSEKTSEEIMETLLKQPEQTINISLIKEMLGNNSKQSMDKLIKLFQQLYGGTQNTEQLKEIMSLLSQITPKKDSTPQEVIKNLILLYLPWFPLAEKQDLQIRFEKHNSSEEEDSEQTALVIYISTINLGRFKVVILLNLSSIKIQIENYEKESQGEKNRKDYLEKILSEINMQTRKDKIQTTTELLISEQKEAKEAQEERKREVVISPVGKISPVVIIVAQKIAKIILEMDEKASLIEKRREMT